jgi:uncharacterized membrane protein YjjB (DUF3815 family)
MGSTVFSSLFMQLTTVFWLHQVICGSLAAAGFGVLFNIGARYLPWCAACGAIALGSRTIFLGNGWNLEAASFIAAVLVGWFVQLLRTKTHISQNTLDVAGCIPMVPGSFAAKSILAMFALTSSDAHSTETLVTAFQYGIRVIFTIGAIGTGLTLPSLLNRKLTSKRI